MNLGKLIECLEQQPADRAVIAWLDDNGENKLNPDQIHIGVEGSYRGHYDHLAFEPADDPSTCGQLLAQCRDAVGKDYYASKGGVYRMGVHTPLWFAEHLECGYKMTFARVETLKSDQTVLIIYVIENDW